MIGVNTIINAATATGAGTKRTPLTDKKTFHVIGNVSASTGAATITVEVSNDGTNWAVIDTLSLTLGTTVTSDIYTMDAPYKYVRGNVTAISGTDATVSLFLAAQF